MRVTCLFIGSDGHDRLFVIRYRVVHPFRSLLFQGDRREELNHFLFHLLRIEIAHHDDPLQVGAIPFVVIGSNLFRFEVINHVDATDWHTVRVLALGVHFREQLIPQALLGTSSGTPLFADHTPFAFQLVLLQQDSVRPVMQHQKCRIHQILVGGRDIAHEVHRFIERGVRVNVGAKLDPVVLQVIEHCFPGKVFSPVKCHMFQEVSQSGLIIFLLHRPHLLRDVEVGPVFGQLVMADVVGEPVLECAGPHVRVHRQWLVLLRERG